MSRTEGFTIISTTSSNPQRTRVSVPIEKQTDSPAQVTLEKGKTEIVFSH